MKISQPLKTTLFPYTTLFRSRRESLRCNRAHCDKFCARPRSPIGRGSRLKIDPVWVRVPRSEEHTSELQSRGHLVCRLLLEKKKIDTIVEVVVGTGDIDRDNE